MTAVLVANRGEIAVRIVRAVHALGWRAIAVHPADDAASAHVHAADEAVELPGAGPAAYLDIDALLAAAKATGADLVHPGYGFLSESAELAQRCATAGLTFVGPSPQALTLFGDKGQARALAEAHGVPVLPGTSGPTTLDDAAAFLAAHGAVMVKAVAGGGGRGMSEVRDPADLEAAYARCSAEAERAFGNGALYVERLVAAPRHVEVQVVGDYTGAVQHLGERDCSLQRRHQKLVEIAPAPALDPALRERLVGHALTLAAAGGLAGLATIEFLVDGDAVSFMEANPRLQVEHTVTEEVTGVDLVATQLRIASGATLADLGLTEPPTVRGVAIQARVNLETLDADGAPQPSSGTLRTYAIPSGPGVRVDTYGYTGYRTSPRYDSLVAKVVAHADTLPAAAGRLAAALAEFAVEGVETNLDLLHALVVDPAFADGGWDTGYLAAHLPALRAHRRPRRTTAGEVAADGPADVVPDGAVALRTSTGGVVLTLDVVPGDVVGAGAPVATVEAMKMEHVVRADQGVRVEAVRVAPGDVVDAGTILAVGTPTDAKATAITARHDEDDWSAEVTEIERRRALAQAMGGPAKVQRQHDSGRLTARERVEALADAGSFAEIGVLTGFPGADGHVTPANFVAGTACIDGRPVALGIDDFTVRGGSGDGAVHAKQIFLEEYARDMRLPVVRLLDGASGGGSVKMAMEAGYTYVPINPAWDAVVDNLSLVPVVAACVGPTVGLGAARLVMSHLSVMVEDLGQLFTAGPPVVAAATGEKLTKEQLGGADIHRANGSVERLVASEDEAYEVVRRFLSYLPSSAFELPPVTTNEDPVDRREEALLSAVPRNPRRPYAIAPVLEAIFDAGSVFPYAEYGGGTYTALARLDGHPVGVVAADPEQGATMSAEGALALTRLVDLCETFHLPLVSLTDQAGMTIGAAAERAATIRAGARAISAVYQARVPQAEIVLRRVYGVGGAGIVNRHRPLRSWAWPSGDWGSLPVQGGIEAAFRAQLEAADDPAAEAARLARELEAVTSPFRTAERFGVQDLIDPRESRALLCAWVRDAYRLLPELLGRPSFGTRP